MSVTLDPPTSAGPARLDFDALYRAARDDVYAYVVTLLRDRSAAEDVDRPGVRARRSASARGYDPAEGGERAWLFGIARNAALDELRRRKRTATLAADPADASAPAPEDAAERASRGPPCAPRSPASPPRERELIALKFHAGLDNAELAAVLGVSVSNAGTLLHRAMTKLREAVDDRS